MAEIILEPTELSKVIPISLKINDTDAKTVTRFATKRQFNTSDTDAWLSFILEDVATTSGVYDLTMVNVDEDPSSVVHHTDIAFSAIPFHYKLDSGEDLSTNEIRHAGRWIGQIVVRLANGDTTSRQFDFAISGHLLDGNEARLILIEDYNSLIATITAAKTELEGYNVDYAALIADVDAKEALREQAEIDRAATFAALVDSEMIAQNVETKLTEKEATYAPRLLSVESELADINTDFQTAAANLTIDSEVILARNGFESLDLRLTDTDVKLSRPQIPVYDFDPETPLVGEMWLIEPSLAKDNFTQPDGLPDANKWLFTKTKRTDTTAVHSVETAAEIVDNSCNIKSSVLLGTEDTKHVEVALRLLSSKVNWTTADRKIKWKQTIGVFGSAGVYLSTAVVVDGGTVMKYTFRVTSDTTTTYVQIINASTLVYNQSFAHGKNLASGLQAFEIEIDKTAGKINVYLNGVLKLSPDLSLTTITDTWLYFYQTTNSTSLQTTIIDDVVVR